MLKVHNVMSILKFTTSLILFYIDDIIWLSNEKKSKKKKLLKTISCFLVLTESYSLQNAFNKSWYDDKHFFLQKIEFKHSLVGGAIEYD